MFTTGTLPHIVGPRLEAKSLGVVLLTVLLCWCSTPFHVLAPNYKRATTPVTNTTKELIKEKSLFSRQLNMFGIMVPTSI